MLWDIDIPKYLSGQRCNGGGASERDSLSGLAIWPCGHNNHKWIYNTSYWKNYLL